MCIFLSSINMKKTIILIFCLTAALGAAAQSGFEQIMARRELACNNYRDYPARPLSYLSPVPEGYSPFYISTYQRHGSRFLIKPSDYGCARRVLQRADSLGVITEDGRRALDIINELTEMSHNRRGELTRLGAEQHQGIAKRMFHNFPEVFADSARIVCRSSTVVRCILSMANECMELKALNPSLRIDMDASKGDMRYLRHTDKELDSLWAAPKARKIMDEYFDSHVHYKPVLRRLIGSEEYLGDTDIKDFMTSLYYMVCNMDSHKQRGRLDFVMTSREMAEFWSYANVCWYLWAGYSPVTDMRMPERERELLSDIQRKAAEHLETLEPGADLRFGHESMLLPLAALMQINDYGKVFSDMETLSEHWRCYEVFPMAGNIQIVFYKNAQGKTFYKVFLNEEEVTLRRDLL